MEPLNILYSIATMAIACFLGVFLASLILEFGFARVISRPLAPLMRSANLPEIFSIPAIISTIDVRGGLSIVGSLKEKNGIDDSTVIAYKLVTRPFSTVFFLFRYYLPVSLAALGFFVGSAYIALSFASALICMLIGIVYGRLRVKRAEISLELPKNSKNRNDVLKSSFNSAIDMTKKVVLRYVVITVIITLLLLAGFFDLVSERLDIYTKQFGFSSNFAALISIHIFSPMSSVLTAGEFLRNGLISVRECLIALLVGRFLFIAIMDYPRHSLPFYASIFPIKLASKLVLAGIAVNAVATPILILLVLLVFPF
ncbi:MAG: hypothetical protein NZ879_05455 [Archaeoglobaceae archaeon]|nr:hypothetical protein [Archaeoglobaceae archaeon]MDW8118412.1 hypothetical protein [Archaeoglobaceae archaeon]